MNPFIAQELDKAEIRCYAQKGLLPESADYTLTLTSGINPKSKNRSTLRLSPNSERWGVF